MAETFTYSRRGKLSIELDLYYPEGFNSAPAIIWFHAGGLTVGNRRSWFPKWLHSRALASGIALICADYTLMPPATGYDILDDIKELFSYLQDGLNDQLVHSRRSIDLDRIAIAGSSAGGLCAYLSVTHARFPARCLLAVYAMGGDLLTDHYLASKTGSNSPEGSNTLNTDDFTEFLWPRSLELDPISDSPIAYHPPESERPNYPANPRMLLPRLYGERGLYLDYYTGSHSPSLSAQLRCIGPPSEAEDEIKEILGQHVHLFPQFADPKSFPPTFLIHGTADIAVLPSESRRMQVRLSSAGRECILREIEGQPHSFDNHPRKESFEELYDEAVDFLKKHLLPID